METDPRLNPGRLRPSSGYQEVVARLCKVERACAGQPRKGGLWRDENALSLCAAVPVLERCMRRR